MNIDIYCSTDNDILAHTSLQNAQRGQLLSILYMSLVNWNYYQQRQQYLLYHTLCEIQILLVLNLVNMNTKNVDHSSTNTHFCYFYTEVHQLTLFIIQECLILNIYHAIYKLLQKNLVTKLLRMFAELAENKEDGKTFYEQFPKNIKVLFLADPIDNML